MVMADNVNGLRKRNKSRVQGAREVHESDSTNLYEKHLKQYGTRIQPDKLDSPIDIAYFNEDSPTTHKSLSRSYIKEEPIDHDLGDPPNVEIYENDAVDDDQLDLPKIRQDLQVLNGQIRNFSNGSIDKSRNKNKWTTKRRSSIRIALGDPLPLPYLGNSEPIKKEQDEGSNEKEKILDDKWNSIVDSNRKLIKERIAEIRGLEKQLTENEMKTETNENTRKDSKSSVVIESISKKASPRSFRLNDDSIIIGTPELDPLDEGSLSSIQNILLDNSRKLDLVLETLTMPKADKNRTIINSDRPECSINWLNSSYDNFFWLGCIVVLLLCNFYVYYYL